MVNGQSTLVHLVQNKTVVLKLPNDNLVTRLVPLDHNENLNSPTINGIIKYSKQQLLNVKTKHNLPQEIHQLLKELGILKTRRSRAGILARSKIHRIPELVGTQRSSRNPPLSSRGTNPGNLICIEVNIDQQFTAIQVISNTNTTCKTLYHPPPRQRFLHQITKTTAESNVTVPVDF